MPTDTDLAARVAALEERVAQLEAAARSNPKPPATFLFPEAGEGRRFPLHLLQKAFDLAQIEVGVRDLRRSSDRVRLRNRRLAGALALAGQRIANGRQGPNTYAVWFDPAVVARAVHHLNQAG